MHSLTQSVNIHSLTHSLTLHLYTHSLYTYTLTHTHILPTYRRDPGTQHRGNPRLHHSAATRQTSTQAGRWRKDCYYYCCRRRRRGARRRVQGEHAINSTFTYTISSIHTLYIYNTHVHVHKHTYIHTILLFSSQQQQDAGAAAGLADEGQDLGHEGDGLLGVLDHLAHVVHDGARLERRRKSACEGGGNQQAKEEEVMMVAIDGMGRVVLIARQDMFPRRMRGAIIACQKYYAYRVRIAPSKRTQDRRNAPRVPRVHFR